MEEISIGDYVLSGGELAAMVLLDAVGAAAARGDGRGGERRGGKFLGRAAGISALHAAGGVAGARGAGRAAVRQPCRGRRLAARAERGDYPERRPDLLATRAHMTQRRLPANGRGLGTDERTLTDEHPSAIRSRADRPAERNRSVPDFAPGDTLRVTVKVVEGERSRTQAFEGVCIAPVQQGAEQQLHRAQDQLQRRRGACVPAVFAEYR